MSLIFIANWGQLLQLVLGLSGVAGVAGLYRFAKCHVTVCHRLGRFPYEHFRYCRVHHPEVPSTGRLEAPPRREGP